MAGASLAERIKAEFDNSKGRASAAEATRQKESADREARLAKFSKVCEDLKGVWRPRLEEFARQFGDSVKVTPTITPSQREAKVNFVTDLANVTMEIRAAADPGITKLVLEYELHIIPAYFEYERTSRLEQPLDAVDRNAVGAWLDDRLVTSVRTYLSVQENEHYLRRALVEDPITKARFLPQDAGAKLDHQGKTVYFASEESLKQYKAKHQIAT